MLTLFRTNQFIANSLLIIYAFVLRIAIFFQSSSWTPPQHGILSEWMYSWVGTNSLAASIVATLLVVFQALLINLMVSEHRIAREVTLFPGVFFVLMSSCLPDFLHLSPLLMANTFYILAMMQLFKTYKKHNSAGWIYNAGLWIGVASLFYFSYIIFYLFGFIALSILRAANIREGIILFFGFLTSYFLLGTYAFWNDQWSVFWYHQFSDNFGFLDFSYKTGWEIYLSIGFFILIILLIVFSYRTYVMKKNIQKQKYIHILYWGLFISLFTALFQGNITIEHFLIIVPPLAILLSFNFLNLSKPIAETLHLLLLFGILIFHFKFWWIG